MIGVLALRQRSKINYFNPSSRPKKQAPAWDFMPSVVMFGKPAAKFNVSAERAKAPRL